MRKLDLHGCTEVEAISKIVSFINGALADEELEVEIITGVGRGVLKTTLENYCDENGFNYRTINSGSYVVYLD